VGIVNVIVIGSLSNAYRLCFGQAPVNKLVTATSLFGRCRNLEFTITITL